MCLEGEIIAADELTSISVLRYAVCSGWRYGPAHLVLLKICLYSSVRQYQCNRSHAWSPPCQRFYLSFCVVFLHLLVSIESVFASLIMNITLRSFHLYKYGEVNLLWKITEVLQNTRMSQIYISDGEKGSLPSRDHHFWCF